MKTIYSVWVIGSLLVAGGCTYQKTEYQRLAAYCKNSVSNSGRHNKSPIGYHDAQGNFVETGQAPSLGNRHSSVKECMGENWKK